MSTPEEEIRNLRENNNELVQKVQFWKMTAAQKENEKFELMKENNELRLQLSRIKSGGAAEARKLEAALQSASKEAISHLVQASSAVARSMELAKNYMRDRQELENAIPRWSNISGTSTTERVRRVPPMMGGRSIQPVVSLSRTILNTSNPRAAPRSPNHLTERAVPMYMLQDVYIPLTRIDANDLPDNNIESDEASNIEDSAEDIPHEDLSNISTLEESQNITEDFEVSRRLDAVTEDSEQEDEEATPPPPTRRRSENPLEGPSWLLDTPDKIEARTPPGIVFTAEQSRAHCSKPETTQDSLQNTSGGRSNLEPDSTTEPEESARVSPPADEVEGDNGAAACAFSPTVRRRRKRTPSPPPTPHLHSPRPRHRRPSTSGRVLKVVVAKMRLEGSSPGIEGVGEEKGDASAPKRPARDTSSSGTPPARETPLSRETPPSKAKQMRFDAPSPNGATDAGVIVSEAIEENAAKQSQGARRGGGKGRGRDNKSRERSRSRDMTLGESLSRGTIHKEASKSENTGRGVLTQGEDLGRDTRGEDLGRSISRREDTVRSRDTSPGQEGASRSGSAASRDSHDSDQEATGRTRRPRKPVVYKEKSLNSKLRR